MLSFHCVYLEKNNKLLGCTRVCVYRFNVKIHPQVLVFLINIRSSMLILDPYKSRILVEHVKSFFLTVPSDVLAVSQGSLLSRR